MGLLAQIESKGSLLALAGVVLVAAALEVTGHLSPGMVNVLEWAGGSFAASQAAAHIGSGLGGGS